MYKIVLFIIFLLSPTIIWFFLPDKPLNVAIIDKTVPEPNFRGHKGLTWILNNQKYVKSQGLRYSEKNDYYGFIPEGNEKYQIKHFPPDFNNFDIIYVADTYGVYQNEFYQNKSNKRNNLLSGGINQTEINSINKSLNNHKKFIFEFNSFSNIKDLNIRKNLYQLLGIEWTGWDCKYFRDLSPTVKNSEVPSWALVNYENQYHKKWLFEGPGLLFSNEDGKIIVVQDKLTPETEISFEFTEKGRSLFGLPDRINYYSWFDIVRVINKSNIIANFRFNYPILNLLKNNGLPDSFPAIIKNENAGYSTYYFAGDFVNNDNIPSVYQFYGLNKIRKFLTSLKTNDALFWRVYEPMMTIIIRDSFQKR